MKTSRLDMQLVGMHLMVYIDIWDKTLSDYRTGLLTFDTGASVTTISKNTLIDLGYDVHNGKIRQIVTASGVENVNEVIIDRLMIGGITLENVLVYAHTFPAEGFNTGVVGLNVLSLFDINLLFSKKIIELSKYEE
ncbi:MAG: retroviral-like aspartic protease family protein [Defluviitaleaceae bacterium]|nr:retroviral-like aspartic protease family protein [Defluviitaleaceae bacterium]